MPRFDQCHDQVVRALEKQGWHAERHQVRLHIGKRNAFFDLRAVRDANGSRQQIMLVEVKCFPDDEDTTQGLYTAIGQYLIYRAMLVEKKRYHFISLFPKRFTGQFSRHRHGGLWQKAESNC